MKEKEDEDARLKSQAKRLDYITRALRIEEMPVLKKKYEAQVCKHTPDSTAAVFVVLVFVLV